MQKNDINIAPPGSPHAGRRFSTYHLLSLSRIVLLASLTVVNAHGQTPDPWSTAFLRIAASVTGPLAKAAALIAICIGGIEIAFGEGNSRRHIGSLILGLGLALEGAQVIAWLFS
jgi:type IV secretory pathway VirB2 component (pilin)